MNDDQLTMVERGTDALSQTTSDRQVEWEGLPEFAAKEKVVSLVISFETEAEREALAVALGMPPAATHASWPVGTEEGLRLDV